jgi:hypothetical protein
MLSMPSLQQSPLARLVLFIAGLAIAAGILAGVLYTAVDLPAQGMALQTPVNSESCTIISTGNCAHIRNTLCSVGGSNLDWVKSCMNDYGCCV